MIKIGEQNRSRLTVHNTFRMIYFHHLLIRQVSVSFFSFFTTVFFLVEIQIDFRSGKFPTYFSKIFQTFSSHAGRSEIAFCIECVFKATLSLWADVMKAISLTLLVGTALITLHLALTYEFWGAAWRLERAVICIQILAKRKDSAGILLVGWTKFLLRQTRIASRLHSHICQSTLIQALR